MSLVRRYRLFTRNALSRLLSYRANVLLFIFGNILQTVVLFYLWRAVFRSSGSATLKGFSFPEMVVYLIASTATIQLIRSGADEVIADEIRDGAIAMNLVRPIDYRLRVLFDSFGTSLYNFAFVGIPSIIAIALVLGFWTAGPGIPLLHVPEFLLSLALAFALNFSYLFCFGLVAFVTTNMWGMSRLEMVVASLLSGSLIPLVFFPDWLRELSTFLPWASMGYTPVMALLGKLEGPSLLEALGIEAAWALFFIWLSGWAWARLVRRLAVNGG